MSHRERDDAPDDESPDVDAMLGDLHGHLAATAELAVETDASRWLGEAEVVAADVADGDAPAAAVETRVGQVRELLAHVEGTGNEAADGHVAAARELAAEIETQVGERK